MIFDPPAANPAARLSDRTTEQLRRNGLWARLAGIAVVVYGGTFGLLQIVGTQTFNRISGKPSPLDVERTLSLLLPLLPAVAALAYARNLRRFAHGDGPALTRAFRTLRVFWTLTAFVYLLLLVDLLWTFGG